MAAVPLPLGPGGRLSCQKPRLQTVLSQIRFFGLIVFPPILISLLPQAVGHILSFGKC